MYVAQTVSLVVALLTWMPAATFGSPSIPQDKDEFLEARLELAQDNRSQLEAALDVEDEQQRASVEFLIRNMPGRDLKRLSADFLLEHVRLAHQAREESAWKISDELFLNNVLPYANVDETRERWRPEMCQRAKKIIEGCKTPGEAAQQLNQKLFREVGVKYSTKRKKANQAPAESIEQGLASCTGLSILLVDACRSVNVPARLVGIPRWANKRGNHTWVEVWDNDNWHFTGAAEYNAQGLNRAWFKNDAAKAIKSSRMNSIYAVSFKKTDTPFPMIWSRGARPVSAINVTDRYTALGTVLKDNEIRVMVRARSNATETPRISIPVVIESVDDRTIRVEGTTKDESADTNNFLTVVLKRDKTYRIRPKSNKADNDPLSFEARQFKTPADKDQLILDVTTAMAVEITADPQQQQEDAVVKKEKWISLFNGKNLDGWTVKIAKHPLGENYANTFRVEDGVLKCEYDDYEEFGGRFGHLYSDMSYSHYRLKLEYRFVGRMVPDAPHYVDLNSGVMLHSQPPQSMSLDQGFPASLEMQFLADLGTGQRQTGNVCTPGTHLVYEGKLTKKHIVKSSGPTLPADQWVAVEMLVRGNEELIYLVEGKEVLRYTNPQLDPESKEAKSLVAKGASLDLSFGHIALQAEGQRVWFRNIELLPLDK